MSAVLSNTPPTRWSSCSTSYLNTGLTTTSIGSCLGNVPTMFVGNPVCGNGIREGNETCDCGKVQVMTIEDTLCSLAFSNALSIVFFLQHFELQDNCNILNLFLFMRTQECSDPCCNAANCTLAKGAQCASGVCCSKCLFTSYGTQCRSASGECDIAEYCGGRSSDCPPDRRVQDGTPCSKGVGYCYSGTCPTVDSRCKYFYGSSKLFNRLVMMKFNLRMYYCIAGGKGYASCFNNYNTRGDLHGNCGSTSTPGTYTPCSTRYFTIHVFTERCIYNLLSHLKPSTVWLIAMC